MIVTWLALEWVVTLASAPWATRSRAAETVGGRVSAVLWLPSTVKVTVKGVRASGARARWVSWVVAARWLSAAGRFLVGCGVVGVGGGDAAVVFVDGSGEVGGCEGGDEEADAGGVCRCGGADEGEDRTEDEEEGEHDVEADAQDAEHQEGLAAACDRWVVGVHGVPRLWGGCSATSLEGGWGCVCWWVSSDGLIVISSFSPMWGWDAAGLNGGVSSYDCCRRLLCLLVGVMRCLRGAGLF